MQLVIANLKEYVLLAASVSSRVYQAGRSYENLVGTTYVWDVFLEAFEFEKKPSKVSSNSSGSQLLLSLK